MYRISNHCDVLCDIWEKLQDYPRHAIMLYLSVPGKKPEADVEAFARKLAERARRTRPPARSWVMTACNMRYPQTYASRALGTIASAQPPRLFCLQGGALACLSCPVEGPVEMMRIVDVDLGIASGGVACQGTCPAAIYDGCNMVQRRSDGRLLRLGADVGASRYVVETWELSVSTEEPRRTATWFEPMRQGDGYVTGALCMQISAIVALCTKTGCLVVLGGTGRQEVRVSGALCDRLLDCQDGRHVMVAYAGRPGGAMVDVQGGMVSRLCGGDSLCAAGHMPGVGIAQVVRRCEHSGARHLLLRQQGSAITLEDSGAAWGHWALGPRCAVAMTTESLPRVLIAVWRIDTGKRVAQLELHLRLAEIRHVRIKVLRDGGILVLTERNGAYRWHGDPNGFEAISTELPGSTKGPCVALDELVDGRIATAYRHHRACGALGARGAQWLLLVHE